MVGVLARAPRHAAVIRVLEADRCLTINAKVHYMVSTNGAIFHSDIPIPLMVLKKPLPERNGVPLFNFKKRLRQTITKKKIASAFAKSSMGKSVVNKTLGPSGKIMMAAVKSFFVKYKGKKEAKILINSVYTISVKAKMMYDSKKLDLNKFESFTEKLYRSVHKFLDLLEGSPGSDTPEKRKKNLDAYYELCALLESLMNPHMKPENQKMLHETLNQFNNLDTLELMLNDKKYDSERKTLFMSMNEILLLNDSKYGLSVNGKLPSDKFKEQYREEIATCKDFWATTTDNRSRVLFSNVVSSHLVVSDLSSHRRHVSDPPSQHISSSLFCRLIAVTSRICILSLASPLPATTNRKLTMAIFNRMIQRDSHYYNQFQLCVHGDDPEKQYGLLVECIDYVIAHLEDWQSLRKQLVDVSRRHAEWGAPLTAAVYTHFNDSFHIAMVKVFPKYTEEATINAFTIMMRLVLYVMEDEF